MQLIQSVELRSVRSSRTRVTFFKNKDYFNLCMIADFFGIGMQYRLIMLFKVPNSQSALIESILVNNKLGIKCIFKSDLWGIYLGKPPFGSKTNISAYFLI